MTFVIAAPPPYRGLKLRAGRKTYTADVAACVPLMEACGTGCVDQWSDSMKRTYARLVISGRPPKVASPRGTI